MELGLFSDASENVCWMKQASYAAAELKYQQSLVKTGETQSTGSGDCPQETSAVGTTSDNSALMSRLACLEQNYNDLLKMYQKLEGRFSALEQKCSSVSVSQAAPAAQNGPGVPKAVAAAQDKGGDDDDVDLFASDSEEDEEAEKLKAERLKAYEAKKSKKPTLIAKSNIILDVKPWDDETDMVEMERRVRELSGDGLVWGVSKLVPLAYGIKKLQISCVVEDDKIGTDWLEENICDTIEDLVQSVDIAAFNKV